MRYYFGPIVLLSFLLLTGAAAFSQSSISLERVNGLTEQGFIPPGQMIAYSFRVQNSTGQYAIAVTNGFRVYSPDGAEWGGAALDTTSEMGRGSFPMGVYLMDFSITGADADTVGFLGIGDNIGLPSGLPDGFSEVGLIVQIGPIPHSSRGLTICLDSSFYYNGGQWMWVLEEPSEVFPSWDGPHCYKVVCCDIRGDVNDDGEAVLDIADLLAMVTYMFQDGPEPFCPETMDVNGSGGIPDIADLTYMVSYMFQGGPDPLPCPFQPK